MAERLPVGDATNIKSNSLASFGSNLASNDILPNGPVAWHNGHMVLYEELETNGSNNQLKPNAMNSRSSGHNKPPNSKTTAKNGSKSEDCESQGTDDEWLEHDEPPGVYITLTSLPEVPKSLNEFASAESDSVRSKRNSEFYLGLGNWIGDENLPPNASLIAPTRKKSSNLFF